MKQAVRLSEILPPDTRTAQVNDFLVAYETAALSFERGSGPKIELPFNSPPQVWRKGR